MKKTISVEVLSQIIMDLYYQAHKSGDDFFTLVHFQYLVEIIYGKLLQMEWERSYRFALQETGRGEPQLSPNWYIEEEVEVTMEMDEPVIVLKSCPFTFMYDKQVASVESVRLLGGRCKSLIRITYDEIWKIAAAPKTDIVWWYAKGQRIPLLNLECGAKKGIVRYIPDLNRGGACQLSNGMQADIVQGVLNLMAQAKNGTVVDMTNNQNPNKVLESEISNAFLKR